MIMKCEIWGHSHYSTIQSLPPMNANLPNKGKSLIEKHVITLERRQRTQKNVWGKLDFSLMNCCV